MIIEMDLKEGEEEEETKKMINKKKSNKEIKTI